MNHKKFLGASSAALLIVIVIFTLAPGTLAQSKFKTLYKFKGGKDGNAPMSGLVFDTAGNLYGTTYQGGDSRCSRQPYSQGCGVIFKVTPNANGSWTERVIHTFNGKDGSNPGGGAGDVLILDGQGNLYGTTWLGGKGNCDGYGCGVAFELIPNADGSWKEKVLHWFTGDVGVSPNAPLIFDAAGNLYGTTCDLPFTKSGPGVVFKLAPNTDGSWTESVLHTFDTTDGACSAAGLIFDPAGNLYSTTLWGGAYGGGVVYQLTPNSDGTWTEKVLYSFTGGQDGSRPQPGVIRDSAGNLYGVTIFGGAYGWGTVFKLAPNQDGTWTQSTLYAFKGRNDGGNPWASLTFDGAGNLYGTTNGAGAYGCGVVFKLTPTSSGPWKEEVLHTLMDKPGCESFSTLILDSAGNLYGTTAGDGTKTFGSVFEITP
jgi:uncharacterized repeat protein (TIGR03803 family)